jgi:hypothetical protein
MKNHLVWLIAIVIFVSTPVYSAEWLKGGSLHKATVQEWRQATYKNRLATSSDWFVSITRAQNPKLQMKLDKLNNEEWNATVKECSKQLEICVSEMASDEKSWSSNSLVATIASTCYIYMYL